MKKILLFAIVATFFVLLSCNKEEAFLLDSTAELSFSKDTLRFDTVFTELGSATRILKVYNTNDQPIKINKIALERGANSSFRINVDGIPTNEAIDVEVGANDSLYIFAEVTVDPDNPLSVSPFIIGERLLVDLNGQQRFVILEAWGQNANYLPSRFGSGTSNLLSCNLGEVDFDDPKPYVIYGLLFIDSCTVNIPEGTQIYVHGGIVRAGESVYNDGNIIILENGRLNIQGTVDNPVTIQGDRLEESFQEVSGQWGGILLAQSKGSQIVHTTIKNARFGIIADSASTVELENSQILNSSSGGIIGIHAEINAVNCLFAGNGGNAVQLEYGGTYNFTYCTLASYGVDNSALRMTNLLCLDDFCNEARFNDLTVRFKNSIVFGSRADEIDLLNANQAAFDYNFENCIVRVDDLLEEMDTPDFFDHCIPCQPGRGEGNVILFKDPSENDYTLDSLSIADGFAAPILGLTIDNIGERRDENIPDAGCFERNE